MKKKCPTSILIVFLLSLLYWGYLAATTSMNISCDAVGYSELGGLLQTKGLMYYIQHGPNREPIYPGLVSVSMHLSSWTGVDYTKIMAYLGVLILFISQLLLYALLSACNIRTGISVMALAYFGFSPALLNTAFSLYSEIATLPVILGIVFISHVLWTRFNTHRPYHALAGLLGFLLAVATFIKAAFEMITPFYLLILFILMAKNVPPHKRRSLLLAVSLTLSMFYFPVITYKWLNFKLNGNYAITNRGSWALYGNTMRRMQPMNPKRLLAAMAYAPGENICTQLAGAKECSFWSFTTSDTFGLGKLNELTAQHLAPEEINRRLISLSAQEALKNPLQYGFLTAVEGSKMFFWESTQIGFVQYPAWLQKIYDKRLFNNALRLILSLLSMAAWIVLWSRSLSIAKENPAIFLTLSLITIYIGAYSFFFILTRYALPIAPLYLICIAYTADLMYNIPHAKNNRSL